MKFQSLLVSVLLCVRAANADIIDDILDAVTGAVTCAGCKALFVPLKGLAALGDSAFTGTLNVACTVLTGTIDLDVCRGAVQTQAPIIAEDLRRINPLGTTSTKLCNALLGACAAPSVAPYTVTFPKTRPVNPKQWVSSGKAPFQVLHFSDVHIDRNYTVGADATCSKPICCRNYADKTSAVQTPAGRFGMRNCDTPTEFAHELYKQIGLNNKFSIFTGDVIEASVWLAEKNAIVHDLQRFTQEISTLPAVSVYPTLGNHEGAPTNAFPRSTTTKATAQFIYDTLSAGWKPIIGEAAANQVSQGSGSYSTLVPGTNLRIISLNTVFWYKNNFWLYDSDTPQPDPNGFLSFLVAQLQAAEDAGQRVWIIGHIPPGGRHDVLLDQSNYFSQIIIRYSNTIAAQFFGHNHVDEFLVGYSDYSKRSASTAIATALITGAITPRSSNPIYKVYDIDPDTYEVMDIKVFRSNTESATFQTQPTWDLVYSARSLYGRYVPSLTPTSSLSPAFWHQLTEVFEKNDEAWNLYRSHNEDGKVPGECDADCKKEMICDMRAYRAENLCSNAKLGLNLRRDLTGRNVVVAHDHEICAGVGLGHVLSAIGTQLSKEQLDTLRSEMRKAIDAALRE